MNGYSHTSLNNASPYRYGFNGMEKDDEVSGEGNSYTAQFWEYDSRVARRWNIDPVVKHHLSPYSCFSNNPIIMVDPKGDDDYFNADGTYNREESKKHNKDGHNIYVLSPDGKSKILLTKMPIKTENERKVVEKVINMYARKVGINHYVKLESTEGKTAAAATNQEVGKLGGEIVVNMDYDNTGGVSDLLSNYHNLSSALEHEKLHYETARGDGLEHAELFSEAMLTENFKRSSQDFKDRVVKGMIGELAEGLHGFTREADVKGFFEKFNEQNSSTLGYNVEYLGTGNFTDYDAYNFKMGEVVVSIEKIR